MTDSSLLGKLGGLDLSLQLLICLQNSDLGLDALHMTNTLTSLVQAFFSSFLQGFARRELGGFASILASSDEDMPTSTTHVSY